MEKMEEMRLILPRKIILVWRTSFVLVSAW